MNGMKVVFYVGHRPTYGVLTTEHATSSYKLPVFVMESGAALGGTEVGALTVLGVSGLPEGCEKNESGRINPTDFYDRCVMAGYRFAKE